MSDASPPVPEQFRAVPVHEHEEAVKQTVARVLGDDHVVQMRRFPDVDRLWVMVVTDNPASVIGPGGSQLTRLQLELAQVLGDSDVHVFLSPAAGRCSFCGKTEGEVAHLVAGPDGAYICDRCVELAAETLKDGAGKYLRPPRWHHEAARGSTAST